MNDEQERYYWRSYPGQNEVTDQFALDFHGPYPDTADALNMVSASLAFDLAVDGIKVLVLHPGWVQTAMSGGFFDHKGRSLPW